MSYQYVDMHTHNAEFDSKIYRLNSLGFKSLEASTKEIQEIKNPFTIGLHPWDVDHVGISDFQKFALQQLDHPLCVGLGEMGLDKARPQTYESQMQIFKSQVQMAQERDLPWIVIHCVRAQNEILKVFKEEKYKGRALFHDYNGSLEDTKRLLSAGHAISLGRKIQNSNTKAHQLVLNWQGSLEKIPWGQIFLETDDSAIKIQDIYQLFSQLAHIPLEQLQTGFVNNLPSEFLKKH